MKKINILIVCVIFFLGCQHKPSTYNMFPKEIILKSNAVIGVDSIMPIFPRDIIIIDSFLLVLDQEAVNPILKYSFPALEFIGTYGIRGNGPGELIMQTQMSVDKDGVIHLLDGVNGKIISYNLRGNDNRYISEIKLNIPFRPVSNVFKITDDTYAIKNLFSEYRMYMSDANGNFADSIFKAPKKKSDVNNNFQIYDMDMCFNAEKNIIAGATLSGEMLFIYNLNEKKEYISIGPNGIPEWDKVSGVTGPTEGFWQIKIVGDKIYTIFSGLSIPEMLKSKSSGGDKIYVYDLIGNPQVSYKLDRKILSFHIDESNNKIYALDVNNPDNQLFVFDL